MTTILLCLALGMNPSLPLVKDECNFMVTPDDTSDAYVYTGYTYSEYIIHHYNLVEGGSLILNSWSYGMGCPGLGSDVYSYMYFNGVKVDSGYTYTIDKPGQYLFENVNISPGKLMIEVLMFPKPCFAINQFQLNAGADILSVDIFSSSEPAIFNYEVYNITGVRVMAGNGEIVRGSNSFTFDMTHLPAGQYIFRAFNEREQHTMKFFLAP